MPNNTKLGIKLGSQPVDDFSDSICTCPVDPPDVSQRLLGVPRNSQRSSRNRPLSHWAARASSFPSCRGCTGHLGAACGCGCRLLMNVCSEDAASDTPGGSSNNSAAPCGRKRPDAVGALERQLCQGFTPYWDFSNLFWLTPMGQKGLPLFYVFQISQSRADL